MTKHINGLGCMCYEIECIIISTMLHLTVYKQGDKLHTATFLVSSFF